MKLIPTGVTRSIGRHILTMKKNSPRTMFVGGIVGIGVSTVLACRATLKLESTLQTFKEDVDGVKADSLERKDLAYVYAKGSASLVRLYGPAILVGGASVVLLTGSHVTLTRRNAALTAAYSALQVSFDQYIQRVKNEIGEERELDLRRGVIKQEVMIDGKKTSIDVLDPNGRSIYSKCFDESNANWNKNAEINRVFIQCQQNYLNHLLHARGHVFLNEVYNTLGFEHTSAGSIVGWVVGNGDSYIDFDIFEAVNSDFVNGYERSIWLDFNVDGIIYDKI